MRLAVDATPILSGGKGLAIFLGTFLDSLVHSGLLRPAIVYVDVSFVDRAAARWPGLSLRPVRSRPALWWERLLLPRYVKRDGVDVLLTGRDRTACEPGCQTAVYLFEVPDYRTEAALRNGGDWYARVAAVMTRACFRSVARRATHFIASSESTRWDLHARYGVEPERISVIYPGVRPRFFDAHGSAEREARRWLAAGRPYVLHFATGDPRDNTRTAVAAFARALPSLKDDVALVLAGVPPDGRDEVKRCVKQFGLDRHAYFAGFLENERLTMAYRGASAYLDPTLYEGFGFQIVEAMASGVPVVSSRVTSVPEVVQDAGLLFEPGDVDGLADGLARVLNDRDLRGRLIEKGRQRAGDFSMERCAAALIATLARVTRGGRT